jgi:putative ABC transport system permease protein
MRWLTQVWTLITFNLKTLPARRGSVLAAVVGMAAVSVVLLGVLSMQQGFRRTMAESGDPGVAFVLRGGSSSEMMSVLTRDDTRLVGEAPGVARAGTGLLVSPELFVVVGIPKQTTGTDANVPFRGVTQAAFGVHDRLKIVEGRPFTWGTNEVIVGRAAQGQFRGLGVGQTLHLGGTTWQVVGAFTGGGAAESELWTDQASLQPAFHRHDTYQSVRVKLLSTGSFAAFKDALTANPRLDVKVMREPEFYAGQSVALTAIITILGLLIGLLMGFGAVFAGLNTMYTLVAARTREIGTLRALGFARSPVLVSVIAESIVLAVGGALLGALVAYLAFDGYQAATLNWQSFSQVAFAFRVTPVLLVAATVYASLLGLVGGLFPALRAARMPVANALRES